MNSSHFASESSVFALEKCFASKSSAFALNHTQICRKGPDCPERKQGRCHKIHCELSEITKYNEYAAARAKKAEEAKEEQKDDLKAGDSVDLSLNNDQMKLF